MNRETALALLVAIAILATLVATGDVGATAGLWLGVPLLLIGALGAAAWLARRVRT